MRNLFTMKSRRQHGEFQQCGTRPAAIVAAIALAPFALVLALSAAPSAVAGHHTEGMNEVVLGAEVGPGGDGDRCEDDCEDGTDANGWQ
ncbi:hypothetical protein [Streptomyces sp. SM12]|uniref:hypothetical protein n=2 Tax=unclassified Streptomyces TaxID=2593676 RepID=UPI000CD52D18|nr:hypothetical protein [Streptomyces sp. SM12]